MKLEIVGLLSTLQSASGEAFFNTDFFRRMTATLIGVFLAAMLAWGIDAFKRNRHHVRSRQTLLRMLCAALEKNKAHLEQMVGSELKTGTPTYKLARAHFDSTVMIRAELLSRDKDLADTLNHIAFETEHINRKLDLLLEARNHPDFKKLQADTSQIASGCVDQFKEAINKLKRSINKS